MNQLAKRQAGFGLVELMIGLLISLVIMAAASTVLLSSVTSNRDSIRMSRLDQERRQVMTMVSRDEFLALNALQTLPARLMCALPESDALAETNVRRLRLSPISTNFDAVIRAYDRVFNGGADEQAELDVLVALGLPGALADGYLRREAGIKWSCA